jgi:alkanesulfonate monooxygenase SsuD/methylene tetrahydromethanopterin reductase-like flavin-dependent oxidoreductase (luciferase family)
MGFTAEEFSKLGVEPGAVRDIKQMFEQGKSIEEAASLVTDGMVDAGFIAGKPKDCIEKIEEMCDQAANYGFDQVCFAKLGPDYNESIEILGKDLLPSIGLR